MKYKCWNLRKNIPNKFSCLTREFIYKNNTNEDIKITITMSGTQIFKPSIKVPIPPNYTGYRAVPNNLQENVFIIQANTLRRFTACYYSDDWTGDIKMNSDVILNKYKINKKIQYKLLDLNNGKTSTTNKHAKCICNTFILNTKFVIPVYFGLNMINENEDTQGLIYQLPNNKSFIKKICISDNNWITGGEQFNFVVGSIDTNNNNKFPVPIYYNNKDFKINKGSFNNIVNIGDYPFEL